MQFKVPLTLFLVYFVETATARRGRQLQLVPPQQQPAIIVVVPSAATPEPSECVRKYARPQRVCSNANEELVLPPARAELPRGLGYFPSAVSLVASYYSPAVEMPGACSVASIPVTSPSSCLTIAAPLNPELALLAKPIIL